MLNVFKDVFNNPDKEVTTLDIFEDKKKTIYHRKGLFSEQIFGPVNDYQCQCGNLRGRYNKGKRCNICGVLCDSSTLRYTEFGFIKLKLPVLFPLITDKIIRRFFSDKKLFKHMTELIVLSDKMLFLNKKTKKLEFIDVIMDYDLNIANIDLLPNDFARSLLFDLLVQNKITKQDLKEIEETYLLEYPVFGIYSLYRLFNSDYFQKILEDYFKTQKKYEIFKDVIFLYKLPVCPPELRPYIVTDTSEIIHDITKKLMSIINVNNSLFFEETELTDNENIIEETVADIYIKDLRALRLQKHVNDYYKLIEDQIKGKYGKIRQYIHGKVIDFSSRGVIVPSLKVKPYEVEIPFHTARKVFSLYYASYLMNRFKKYPNDHYLRNLALRFLACQHGVITENQLSDKEIKLIDKYFDDFIDEINSGKYKFYSVVNRPPTLWIYNFLVFDVKVKKDRNDYTIGLHPLCVEQMNADHDGDSINGKIKILINNSEYTLHISELENFKI